MTTVLVETAADGLAPRALVVGFIRVTTDDVSFRSIVPNPERELSFALERIRGAVFESPAVVIDLDDGSAYRFITADGASLARAVEQACVAREKKNVYR